MIESNPASTPPPWNRATGADGCGQVRRRRGAETASGFAAGERYRVRRCAQPSNRMTGRAVEL